MRMRRLKGLKRVHTTGYQTFYGIENTIRSQMTIAKTLRGIHPLLMKTCEWGLVSFQLSIAGWLDELSDEDVVLKLRQYDFHPDNLDVLQRFKSDVDLVVTKQRKRNLIRL